MRASWVPDPGSMEAGEFRNWYHNTYLNSGHWASLRSEMIKEADCKCAICGGGKNLQVHHISYDNLGNETKRDLMVLCEPCHLALHATSDDTKKKILEEHQIAWERIVIASQNELEEYVERVSRILAEDLYRYRNLHWFTDPDYDIVKSSKNIADAIMSDGLREFRIRYAPIPAKIAKNYRIVMGENAKKKSEKVPNKCCANCKYRGVAGGKDLYCLHDHDIINGVQIIVKKDFRDSCAYFEKHTGIRVEGCNKNA